jgi:GMP synthase (glutamine-hydrolysing)
VLGERTGHHRLARIRQGQVQAPGIGYLGLDVVVRRKYSATEDYPWMENALALIREAAGRSLPTFGSCWGHQMIARALGGTVVHDPGRAEFGCREVVLTDAGRRDRLFRDFPARFLANMGHHDRVTALPEGGIELADNDVQPFEAFRIAGKPIYGTQFHSELDARRERERLHRYRGHYSDTIPDEAAFQAILDNLAETSEVDHLLHDFLLKFVVNA